MKEDERKQAEKRAKDFQKWLKVYENKKPLYQEIEDRYVEQVVLKDKEDNLRKMISKKNHYGPMDFDGLDDHQDLYSRIKEDRNGKREAAKRMRQKAEEERKKEFSELHKGQFRYYVLEEMLKQK